MPPPRPPPQQQHLYAENDRQVRVAEDGRQVRMSRARRNTMERVADPYTMVRQRLVAASYRNGKRDFPKLFRHYDRNNNGDISVEEFVSLVRRDGKVARSAMSDRELELMFVQDVDKDQSGTIEYGEFEAWILNRSQSPPTSFDAFAVPGKQDKPKPVWSSHVRRMSTFEKSPTSAAANMTSSTIGMRNFGDKKSSKKMEGKRKLGGAPSESLLGGHNVHARRKKVDQSKFGPQKWQTRGWVGVTGKQTERKRRTSMASLPQDKFSRDRRVAARNKRAEKAMSRLQQRSSPSERADNHVHRRKSVAETLVRIADPYTMVRQRLVAASFRDGKRDFPNLFRHYDRNNNGDISMKEFMSLARRDGKIARSAMSDAQLERMFIEDVDTDGSGTVEYSEFEAWILNRRGNQG